MKISISLVIYLISLSLFINVYADDDPLGAETPRSKAKSTSGSAKDPASCETIFNQTASLVGPVLLVGSDKFPLTQEAIDKHCQMGSDVYKGMRKYGKCVNGLGRQALNVFLHGLKKFMRSICLSQKKKEDTIRDLKCATKGTLEGWNKCLHASNRQLDFAAGNSSGNQLVGDICCVYSSLLECIEIHTGTSPDCPKEANTPKFFKSSVAHVLKEVLELICSRYASHDECKANNPLGLEKLIIAGNSDTQVDGAFLLSPVLKVVLKLGAA